MSGLPRRILMTVDAVGGVWRYALDLAAGLKRSGIDVALAGQGPQPSAAQRREAEALGPLHWLDGPLDWMAAHEAELAGVPDALERTARQCGVELMHLNLPSQAARLETRRPVVAVSHSCVPTWFRAVRATDCPPGWSWQKRLNREGLARAGHVVAPSHSHAAMLEDCYGPIRGVSVVHNGTAATAAKATRQTFVLAAGRWWDEAKNGAVLDEAAGRSPWPVRLAGPLQGAGGAALSLRHAQGLGILEHGALRQLMAEAGIVVSPSLYEPFGLAALEAARGAAPLVLADIPTYRELWTDAALFAAPRDPATFAAAIRRLAADPELRADMGERAAARARRFSAEAQVSGMLAVYRSAMRETKRPAFAEAS